LCLIFVFLIIKEWSIYSHSVQTSPINYSVEVFEKAVQVTPDLRLFTDFAQFGSPTIQTYLARELINNLILI
jgi:hypothetical protein